MRKNVLFSACFYATTNKIVGAYFTSFVCIDLDVLRRLLRRESFHLKIIAIKGKKRNPILC